MAKEKGTTAQPHCLHGERAARFLKINKSMETLEKKEVRDYITIVKSSEDINELQSADIDLEELKGELFRQRRNPNSTHDDVDIMAQINVASKLQEICKERVLWLRDKEQQICYNFLKNSQYFINKKTFDEIYQSALLPRSMFRENIIKQRGKFEKIK